MPRSLYHVMTRPPFMISACACDTLPMLCFFLVYLGRLKDFGRFFLESVTGL